MHRSTRSKTFGLLVGLAVGACVPQRASAAPAVPSGRSFSFRLKGAAAIDAPVGIGYPLPARNPVLEDYYDELYGGMSFRNSFRRFGAIPSPLYSSFGSALYSPSVVLEMGRLFSISGGDGDWPNSQIGIKGALSLPLLGMHNVPQLLVRPMGDIYDTYGKRLALKRLRRLAPIHLPPGCIAIDTHVHTSFSHDSLADAAQMLVTASHRGLSGIAVTDHDTLEGARVAGSIARRLIRERRLPADFLVIPGEEVSSRDGHIIGLFLTRDVPPGLSAADTIADIHEQGGLAVAAHPELPDGVGIRADLLPFDAVETANGAEELEYSMESASAVRRRDEFYRHVTKPRLGASDAHDPGAIGVCYTVLRCAPEPDAVRAAILSGQATPAVRVTGQQMRADMSRGLFGKLLAVESMDLPSLELNRWLRRMTGSTSSRINVWPRPTVVIYRRF